MLINNKIVYIPIVLILLINISVNINANQSQSKAEYGWQMLTIPPNTSISSMAGTGASISPEASSFISHPTAGLLSQSHSISVSQTNWHFDTIFNSIAINLPRGSRSLGFALRSLDYGKFDTRDISGRIIGEFHPLDLNIIGNAAFRVSPNYYFGFNLFVLYQKIESSSSLGWATDLGITYLTPVTGLDIHAAIKHLGATTSVKQESIKLPLTPEISFGYRLPDRLDIVYCEFKILSHPDDDDLKFVTGINTDITEHFSINFGHRINYDSHNYSAGMGLNVRNLIFNYSFLPFKHNSDDAHSFSISYLF